MHLFDIDLDQQEIEATSKNKSQINQHFQKVNNNKYAAGTYTKGFFNADLDEDFQPSNHITDSKKIEKGSEETKNKELEKRKVKKGPITLVPLKQSKNTEIFENYSKKQEYKQPEIEEIDRIPSETSSPLPNLAQKKYETRRMAKKRLTNSRKEIEVEKQEAVQQPMPLLKAESPIFLQEDEEEIQQTTRRQPQPQAIQKPQQQEEHSNLQQIEDQVRLNQNRLVRQVFQESEDEESQVPVLATSDYFNYSSLNLFKKQLSEDIRRGSLLRMEVIRDKDGFNTFWPEFHLYFCDNNHYVMSAKKTSSKPSSTFIISISKTSFQENSQFYLGKMKSNILGDVLNVFGPGLNPSNARDKNKIPRQMIATIVYDSHIFQLGKPRQFQVYVKKSQYNYYSHFPQVKLYEDEIPLNQLFEYAENREKIKVYHNRRPQWLQQIGGYMLNFKGRVQIASVKNFILEEKTNGPQSVIFGKVTDSKFNLDMCHPISPLIAFAVALSSFDSRIMCE